MGESIIKMRDVTFRYPDETGETRPVVNGVTLDIEKHSYVTIMGHNGSGKSTLAKMCNGLLLPSKGQVLVKGLETDREETIGQIRRLVGYVFQNPDNQIVGMSVEEDVAFGLENLGMPPEHMRRAIREALEKTGLAGMDKEQPHRLSGGQKQRLAIAGILAMKPEVIVLDEATSMLDPQGRREVLDVMRRLNREEGVTVVHITHFPEEALEADRLIVLRNGRIWMDGRPAEVFVQTDRLREAGVDVPFSVRLWEALQQAGISLPFSVIIHRKELVDEVCRLLLKT